MTFQLLVRGWKRLLVDNVVSLLNPESMTGEQRIARSPHARFSGGLKVNRANQKQPTAAVGLPGKSVWQSPHRLHGLDFCCVCVNERSVNDLKLISVFDWLRRRALTHVGTRDMEAASTDEFQYLSLKINEKTLITSPQTESRPIYVDWWRYRLCVSSRVSPDVSFSNVWSAPTKHQRVAFVALLIAWWYQMSSP